MGSYASHQLVAVVVCLHLLDSCEKHKLHTRGVKDALKIKNVHVTHVYNNR